MNRTPDARRLVMLKMLVEGSGIRSISRVIGVSTHTVLKLLVDAGRACLQFHDATVCRVRSQHVQLDEAWSFIYAKQKSVGTLSPKAPPEAGDAWTWVAFDPTSKLIISCMVGQRDQLTARAFAADLRARLISRPQISSDGLDLYVEAIEESFGADVDYGQVVKTFGAVGATTGGDGDETPEGGRRSGPSVCTGIRKRTVSGNPDQKHISTSLIERQNLNLRMGVRRYNRRTNAFSRKLENHIYHTALFVTYFNWIRRHDTTRVTPAMAAGLTETWFSERWLLDVVDMYTPEPKKPGPAKGTKYRTRR